MDARATVVQFESYQRRQLSASPLGGAVGAPVQVCQFGFVLN